MGLYTEVIKERDRKDRELVRIAEDHLKNHRGDFTLGGESDGAFLALSYILDRYGIAASETYGYKDITEMLDLILDPLGVIYDEINLSDGSWKKRTDNILAFLDNGCAVALMPAVAGYSYICPETGEKGHITDKVRLKDEAYIIQRPIEIKSVNLLSLSAYVLHLVSMRDIILIGAATLLVTVLGLVTPKMNEYVLDDVVPLGNDGYSLLMRGLFLFLLTGIIRSGIIAAKSLSLARMKVRIPSEVQSAVMSRVLLLPQRFFTETSTGKLSRQIGNTRLLSEQIINCVMGASLTAVFSLIYIPQMASFSAVLLVPALAVLLIRCVYTIVASFFFAENERIRQDAELENRAFTYTALKGIQRIKESGAEKRIYAGWADKYRPVLASDLHQPVILKIEDTVMSFLTSLTTVLLLSLVVPNGIPKADYIAFNASFALISAAITDLMDTQRRITQMKPMLAQMKPLLETPREDGGGQTVLRKFRGDIRVENVDFSYAGSSVGCLRNVSLHISPGEKIAIVGESGCGKSTLLKLILGFIKPDNGSIFIDGAPLDTINHRSFRRRIGAVFQFSKVMPGTVYSNIAFCNRPVSRDEAREAAVKADIDESIMQLPLGYDTEISDSNTGGFSGGQRQRLLLARAFASNPGLMILDEATSALDNLSQNRVLESVYKEKCTVIMVAHRLSTVRNCDRIIVIKEGSIAEQGTFDDLMEQKGEFYELMRRQTGKTEDVSAV